MKGSTASSLAYILAGSIALHLALVLGEAVIPHSTRDAARAFAQMTRGAYRIPYWSSVLLSFAATAAALGVSPLPGGLCSLVALLPYEHAYVQGGQSVPLS